MSSATYAQNWAMRCIHSCAICSWILCGEWFSIYETRGRSANETPMDHLLTPVRSNTYGVYMKVLQDIDDVVDAIASGSIDSVTPVTIDPTWPDRPPTHTGAASSSRGQRSAMGLGPSNIPRTDLNHRPRGGKFPSQRGNGSHTVATRNRDKSTPSRLIECPDYKHHLMDPSSRTPPCRGCRAENMSKVRHHLNRTKHPGHRGVWTCCICTKPFNCEQSRDQHADTKSCQTQAYPKREIDRPWAMLYLTLYSDAQSIPSPCKSILGQV